MKFCSRLLILIIAFLNCFILIVCVTNRQNDTKILSYIQNNDRLENIKQKGVLTVASSNDIPFAYIDPYTKEFTGIDAEIIKEVAIRLGVNKVEIKEVPFQNLLTRLNTDDSIDIVADGMYVTDQRKKEALFTNIWYKESEAILTPIVSKIVFKENLKDAIVGAQKGTAFLELVQKWKQTDLVKDVRIFENQPELLYAVNAGKVDAAITDAIVASYLLSKDSNLYLKILSLKEYQPESIGNIAAAVRKSDTTLANAINIVIDQMKEDGTIALIFKKFGLSQDYFAPVRDDNISQD